MYRRRVDVCWLAPCSRTSSLPPSGCVIARLRLVSTSGRRRRLSGGGGWLRREPRALVLADQACLPHADVEMVPGQRLLERALPVRVEVGVAVPLPERRAPVALEARRTLQEVC